ncbi:MAG: chromosomal replication initiator protein DnaA [Elusimicrobia bacterium]|nr:chromosomal replication initiator protein DnaA [Elusimicrobiota bacterium]
MELKALWADILSKLEKSAGQDDCEIWLKPVKPLVFENNLLKLEVPNQVFYETIHHRFEPAILAALKEIAGLDGGVIEYSISLGASSPSPVEYEQPQHPQQAPAVSKFTTKLNPTYNFEEFIEAPSNRLAYASAQAVTKKMGDRSNNPLVIYSRPGLGKTHLMHAIGNGILKSNPAFKVLYMSAEDFVNEYIESLQSKNTESFRNKYRNLDCFLVDDIQFVVGKAASEKEFFYTFNALFESGKQIVATSDRSPKELAVDERLSTRLYAGLVAEIKPPDIETRIAILRKKREVYNYTIPDDVIVFIGTMVKSSIRELEGCLIRLNNYCITHNSQPTVDIAKEVLSDIIQSDKPAIDIDTIKKVVGKAYSIEIQDFKSPKRSEAIALPRQIAMYLADEMTEMSLTDIGKAFEKDHSTVVHARDKIKTLMNTDTFFNEKINHLIADIRNAEQS